MSIDEIRVYVAQVYRQRADEARELARRSEREDARQALVEMADLWSALATRIIEEAPSAE